ncbi:hypothetical protein BHE74_00048545 [Ensete ventricosum]|nr:hypothetical protein BHE74_00048545 [Ensete ventricosum]
MGDDDSHPTFLQGVVLRACKPSELCRFEGPDGGIGVALGKNQKTPPDLFVAAGGLRCKSCMLLEPSQHDTKRWKRRGRRRITRTDPLESRKQSRWKGKGIEGKGRTGDSGDLGARLGVDGDGDSGRRKEAEAAWDLELRRCGGGRSGGGGAPLRFPTLGRRHPDVGAGLSPSFSLDLRGSRLLVG